jgi:hypothetical protein
MNRNLLPVVLAVATLAACESATAPSTAVDQSNRAAVLSGSASGAAAVSIELKTKQVSSGETLVIGWCDQAGGVLLTAAPGTGTATHIGRFEVQQTQCVNPTTGAATDGVATLTAANGDEIYMTYDGQFVPGEPPTADLFYTVTGGTGRFTHAQGEIEVRVIFTSPSTWVATGSGWISYSASDRSAN